MTFLQSLKEKAERATKGPWVGDRFDGTVKYQLKTANGAVIVNCDDYKYGFISEEDSEYVKAAQPQTILALIAALETAREGLDEMSRLPYRDSNIASLLEWSVTRAGAITAELDKLLEDKP